MLVASPNEGTPLATPKRWDDTVGWFANILEMFPDNPFTTGASFVGTTVTTVEAVGELVLSSPLAPPFAPLSVSEETLIVWVGAVGVLSLLS